MPFTKLLSHVNKAQEFIQEYDCFLYSGHITQSGYEKLSSLIPESKKDKALLILSTYGGDPDAGYRIARCLNHHYEKFDILIPYKCKSAGTLICIGASQLLMSNKAELGPLDIQLRKQDEIAQNSSGLALTKGLNLISEQAIGSFRSYLYSIINTSGISTKTASEISSNLVIGLFQPIFAQIDPVKFGETSAALSIAANYGERLSKKSKNLKEGKLHELIHGFPSHSFVIDRSEARNFFKNVNGLDEYDEHIERAFQCVTTFLSNKNSIQIENFNELLNDLVKFFNDKNNIGENTNNNDVPTPTSNDSKKSTKKSDPVRKSSDVSAQKQSEPQKLD